MNRMKVTAALLLGCALVSPAFAAPGKTTSAKTTGALTKDCCSATSAKKAKAKPATLTTGTYLKRSVSRNGTITDGPSHVIVFDSEAIRNSGASNVRDFLVRRGAYR